MRILTLNINMFNYDIDNSLFQYINKIEPTITIIQEAKYKKIIDYKKFIKKENILFLPYKYDTGQIKSSIHLTVAFGPKDIFSKDPTFNFGDYNYSHIKLLNEKEKFSILGVHTPRINDDSMYKEYIDAYNADIICGDFNASKRKPESLNYKLYESLCHKYVDLWEKSLIGNKAYYYNFKGQELCAEQNTFYRTYIAQTHIDYILGSPQLNIDKMIIDYRTLAFTDHCAVIIDI